MCTFTENNTEPDAQLTRSINESINVYCTQQIKTQNEKSLLWNNKTTSQQGLLDSSSVV